MAQLLSVRQLDFMGTPNPTKKPSSGWILFCRLFVCGFGVFFVGAAVHLFKESQQVSLAIAFLAGFGLLLIGLGIFTSAKICEKIADSITCGF